jgi:hypothetical protein
VTVYAKENDSISQKWISTDYFYSFWSFKDTIGGTKITGKRSVKWVSGWKFLLFLMAEWRFLGEIYEKSLANIDKTLDFELNSFAVR